MKKSGLKMVPNFNRKNDPFIHRYIGDNQFDRLLARTFGQPNDRFVVHIDTITVTDLDRFCEDLTPILHSWWAEERHPEGLEATIAWLEQQLEYARRDARTFAKLSGYHARRLEQLEGPLLAKIRELTLQRYPEAADAGS